MRKIARRGTVREAESTTLAFRSLCPSQAEAEEGEGVKLHSQWTKVVNLLYLHFRIIGEAITITSSTTIDLLRIEDLDKWMS